MERKEFLSDLEHYIKLQRCKLNSLIDKLGWNAEELAEVDVNSVVSCPFDAGHRMPASSLAKHVETCSWIHEGYTKEEKDKALPSSAFLYENSTSVVSVFIDKETQKKIISSTPSVSPRITACSVEDKEVPRTMERAITDLTQQERLSIYEYVVAKAKESNKRHAVTLEDLHHGFEKKNGNQEEKEKSHLEKLAEQRDYKRRRQSYRAKNVHITKKSYTEVMREVIQNHMDVLESIAKDENVRDGDEPSDSSSHRNIESRRSVEKHTSRSSKRSSSAERRHGSHKKSSHKKRHRSSSKNDGSSSEDRHRHHHHRHKHRKHKKSHKRSSSSNDD